MLNQLDDVFHALTDPSRRLMVERLAVGDATVSELAKPLRMSLSAVIQHVRVLESSGLVTSAKVGRVRTCRLDERALDAAQSWFAARRADWNERLDRLGDFLDETPHKNDRSPTSDH